jgi:ABC-type Fe3+/spermidine/putrescine transport system ATPase subunit
MPACQGVQVGLRGAAALRPESLSLHPRDAAATRNHVSGRVRERLYEGDVTYFVVELADGSLLRAIRTNDDPAHVNAMPTGSDVALQWAADAVHFIAE